MTDEGVDEGVKRVMDILEVGTVYNKGKETTVKMKRFQCRLCF